MVTGVHISLVAVYDPAMPHDAAGPRSHRSPGSGAGLERLGVRDLRQNLSRAIARAAAGERIIITVDGRPSAQLGPLEPDDTGPTIEDLVARGLVEPPIREDRPEPTFSMPLWAGTRLDQILREVRGR